jgi:hypothetical protein
MKKSVIIPIIIVAILILSVVAFQFLKKSPQPQFIKGEETLEITVTMNNGVPLGKLEVDLWKAGSEGIPDAGYNFTDEKGIVIFNIPEGEYEIGFNLNNFPENLVYPEKTFVAVEKNIPASKTILIYAKQE